MANIERFTEKEIPYKTLEQYGLTQQMIDDLPQGVIQQLLSSRKTPLLPLRATTVDGHLVQTLSHLSLTRMPNGDVDVCFAPQWADKDLGMFNEQLKNELMEGKVTTADFKDMGLCYIQYDNTVNMVLTVPTTIVDHNIMVLSAKYGLSQEQTDNMRNGLVVEIDNGDMMISAGIDLTENEALRIAKGDTLAWKEDAKAGRLPKYNFGIGGCWIADDDNSMSYVKEDDYSDEIWDELKRRGNQNMTRQRMSQISR